MKKSLLFILSALMIIMAVPMIVEAEETPSNLPYLTSTSVGFIDYSGVDTSDGSSAENAKKTFGSLKAKGVVSLLGEGGTMVVSGKAYAGAEYTLPKLSSPLLITSQYGGTNYMDPTPASNPNCAFKMISGVSFSIQSDVILDNIIFFQQSTQNSIVVKSGATLVVGSGVVNMSKQKYQMKIVVEAGGTAIIGGGNFVIENNGGKVYENYTYQYSKLDNTSVTDPAKEVDINVDPGVGYISYNSGDNNNDGKTAETAKKQLLELGSNGVMSIVAGGGTIVASGRLYVGANYTIPKLGSELLITGSYGGTNYVDATDEENPAGGTLKLASGKILTIGTDTRFENLIIFQEGTSQNTIRVASGATLTIGENVVCMTVQDFTAKIVVEAGATLVFTESKHGFDSIEGEGIVIMPDEHKFNASRIYVNQFTDVTMDKWFYNYVKTAYEYTLANGTSATKFSPDSKFTVAQALTAAVNIHKAYYGKTVASAGTGEAWYVPYVNYCIENGIITATQFGDYNKNITRGEMAIVFASILPDSEYTATRSGSNPDVTSGMACYAAVTKLYNAGIVGGDAGTGNFRPNDEIVRSEACVIFTRIAASENRAK